MSEYETLTTEEIMNKMLNMAHTTYTIPSENVFRHISKIKSMQEEILKRANSKEAIPKYKQEMVHDYITTYSGKKFFVTNPQTSDVNIEDIAHALSRSTRYTGHTKEKFYSVGEHSIYCGILARNLGLSKRIQLIALLHDASEAYCSDINRPLKQHLNDYKNAEDKIMNAIWEYFNIQPTEEEYKIIKKLDNTVLVMELKQLMYCDSADIPDVEHFDFEFDITQDLSMNYVKEAFIDGFEYLTEQLGGI